MRLVTERMIYVIGTMDGPKKIGYARNPGARLRGIRSQAPAAKILEEWPVSHEMAVTVESIAHVILSDRRIEGEWFRGTLRYLGTAIDAAFLVAENPSDIDLAEVRRAAHRGRMEATWVRWRRAGIPRGGSVARHSDAAILEFASLGIRPGAKAARMSVSGFQKALIRARKAKEAKNAKRNRKI